MNTASRKIAVFASGAGTNAENIISYFQSRHNGVEVALVVTNRSDAGVIERSERLGVPVRVISKEELDGERRMIALLEEYDIELVVLAGFLLMVPRFLIERYRDRMVNIHPSLLPKFGGKGMYGRRVHEAVVAAGESETGMTVHIVSERYDEGRIIFQASVSVFPSDTPRDVDLKVRALELAHYPHVIERFLLG
ncbi:MAG: phosphoribosylglycinamide formyltransferase [Bacteroidales bacterium]|nr:phosphoribosylglycinamide formyltransferase [Bacteroidales bacterium]